MYPLSKPQPEFIPSWGRTPASRKDTGPGSLRKQCYLEVPFYSHHPLGGFGEKSVLKLKVGKSKNCSWFWMQINTLTNKPLVLFHQILGPKKGHFTANCFPGFPRFLGFVIPGFMVINVIKFNPQSLRLRCSLEKTLGE